MLLHRLSKLTKLHRLSKLSKFSTVPQILHSVYSGLVTHDCSLVGILYAWLCPKRINRVYPFSQRSNSCLNDRLLLSPSLGQGFRLSHYLREAILHKYLLIFCKNMLSMFCLHFFWTKRRLTKLRGKESETSFDLGFLPH